MSEALGVVRDGVQLAAVAHEPDATFHVYVVLRQGGRRQERERDADEQRSPRGEPRPRGRSDVVIRGAHDPHAYGGTSAFYRATDGGSMRRTGQPVSPSGLRDADSS